MSDEATVKDDNKYDSWCVESAYRTIKEAEEYKNDKKMMGLVQAEADKQEKAMVAANKAIRQSEKVSDKLAKINKKMAEDD